MKRSNTENHNKLEMTPEDIGLIDEDEELAIPDSQRSDFIKEYLEDRSTFNADDDWDTGNLAFTDNADEEKSGEYSNYGFHVEDEKQEEEEASS